MEKLKLNLIKKKIFSMRKRLYFGFHFLGYTNFRQQDLLKLRILVV